MSTESIADALSWARTYIDEGRADMTREQIIDMIDTAIAELQPGSQEDEDDRENGYPPRCTNSRGHQWDMTDAEADACRGNVRCVYCGADGDA